MQYILWLNDPFEKIDLSPNPILTTRLSFLSILEAPAKSNNEAFIKYYLLSKHCTSEGHLLIELSLWKNRVKSAPRGKRIKLELQDKCKEEVTVITNDLREVHNGVKSLPWFHKIFFFIHLIESKMINKRQLHKRFVI